MTKQEKICKMIEMQKKFIEKEHASGVTAKEYFVPAGDSPLKDYREEYVRLAMEVVDDAHEEVGSHK